MVKCKSDISKEAWVKFDETEQRLFNSVFITITACREFFYHPRMSNLLSHVGGDWKNKRHPTKVMHATVAHNAAWEAARSLRAIRKRRAESRP